MTDAGTTPNEFATAMQQLSAQAAKTTAPPLGHPVGAKVSDDAGMAHVSEEFQALTARIERFEASVYEKIDQLISISRPSKVLDFALRFQKIDEQLNAIRSTESVNQRLFDSLHEELLKYRDNFLHESLQKPFIHDLVMLFDDLSSLSEQLKTAANEKNRSRHVSQWHENLENAIHSLVEILHRFEVKEIEPQDRVDRALHRVVSHEPADFAEDDGRIVMRVRRGFFWRGKLIRPEEVIAKRFG